MEKLYHLDADDFGRFCPSATEAKPYGVMAEVNGCKRCPSARASASS